MSGKGRAWELALYNEISRNTTNMVHGAVSDYSGSAASSFCDLEVYHFVRDGQTDIVRGEFIELKKRRAKSGNRCIVMGGSATDESGLEELERLIDEAPHWGHKWVVVSFNKRKPIVINAESLYEMLRSDVETDRGPPQFDVRLTDSDSISMRKPTTDVWKSASAADTDWKVVLDVIGVDDEYIQPQMEKA